MEYANLNNGVKMPMAGIGTFLLTPDEAEASCVSALQNGYRLIDTANAYVNEKAVGRAMKKSGLQREEIFLETKLWPSFYEQPDAVNKTLARLDTPYIDLLLIHQPAGNYVAGYRQMEKAYKEGKVRAIGLSNFNKEQIEEILSICEVKPAVLQTELHPYHQEPELKAFLKENGIVPQAWYPLGHGDKALLQEPLFAWLGKKYGKSAPQIILRWHIQSGNIVIPGSKNPDHIKSNFDLFDFALTEDEMAQVAALNKNVRYYTSTPEMLKKYAEMVRRWTSRSEALSFACFGACAGTGSRGVWSRYSSADPAGDNACTECRTDGRTVGKHIIDSHIRAGSNRPVCGANFLRRRRRHPLQLLSAGELRRQPQVPDDGGHAWLWHDVVWRRFFRQQSELEWLYRMDKAGHGDDRGFCAAHGLGRKICPAGY